MADMRNVQRRRPRIFRIRPNYLDTLPESSIKEKYRLSGAQIRHVHGLIEEDIKPRTMRSHPISSMTKLLITLQFLAKGEFYSEGGLIHGVSKSSVCKCIWQVIEALDRRLNNINFPRTPASLATMKRKFYNVARIPNCIGAVDGTLIPILAPKLREDIFVCRKGYHAINIQADVDPDMRFVDVVAQWPGSTHDSTIFESCGLKAWLETGDYGWLVGDSGYALKPYLVTPKIRPTTRQEIAFNNAHSRTRMVVERAFGILKSRFRCLHKTGGFLQVTPERAAKVFVVCTKLHNLCIDNGVGFDGQVDQHMDMDNQPYQGNAEPNAQRTRDALINTCRF